MIEIDDPAPTAAPPLAGIRIVELGNIFSLPYAAALMSDLGAEVIKIEGPERIDATRMGAYARVYPDNRPGEDHWNQTGTYNVLNRGKKSLALDLRQEQGRDVLRRLIGVSDVLMENFTPRVMRNWGLDFANARKLQPGLIMASCSGYGPGGPYAEYPAQATTQEATHGLAFVTGYRRDEPSKAGISFVDFLATWSLVTGVMLALRHRRRFGKGLWIDVGMYQLGCSMVSERILDWQVNGRRGERIGNRHPWFAPQGCYPCAGNDQWCTISVHDDAEWAALCGAIGQPELAADLRFATNEARREQHDAIDAIIAAWMAEVDKFEAMDRLQAAGVRAGAVFDARDLHLDRHVKARGFLEKLDFPPERGIGTRPLIGRPWRFGRMPLAMRGPGPALGAHNREILQDLLGMDAAECDALEAAKVIAPRPLRPAAAIQVDRDEAVRRDWLAYWDPDFKSALGIDG